MVRGRVESRKSEVESGREGAAGSGGIGVSPVQAAAAVSVAGEAPGPDSLSTAAVLNSAGPSGSTGETPVPPRADDPAVPPGQSELAPRAPEDAVGDAVRRTLELFEGSQELPER